MLSPSMFSQKLPLTAQEQMVPVDYDSTHTTLYVFCPKHTRLITLMYRKSHSVIIPFAQSLLITCPCKAISNPGREYEVPLKPDKVLTGIKGPSGDLLLLRKLTHLVASSSWRLTGHPSTRFPILHGLLSAGSHLSCLGLLNLLSSGYPPGVLSTTTSTEKTAFP